MKDQHSVIQRRTGEYLLQYTVPMSTRPGSSPFEPRPAAGSVVSSFLAWTFIIVLAGLALWAVQPPTPLPASAPPTEFSAERAMTHIQAIARTPHPIGSPANDAVRDYLVAQLASLGLQPQVVSAIGVNGRGGRFAIGNTQDIVGRLPGSANSRAILLMAHYDSVSRAPGAGDDGAGVAGILEAVRALKAGPTLKNDVIVLFSDGEEAGLLGAEAFVASNPAMKDVGLVMNFEGRGDRGASLLFETSNNNRPLIEAVAHAAPHPTGSSLFYAFYKLLPNDTDFTVFRPSHTPGLNFAFGERLDAYHTRLDTPENLSPASLQHHGSYALALTRHFGQMDLGSLQKSTGDDVFFDWFGSRLITYSESRVIPAQILATLLLVFAVLLALRGADVRVGKILLALLACLAILLAVVIVAVLAGWIMGRVLAGHMIVPDSSANSFLLAGYILLGACAGSLVFAACRRQFRIQELSLAGLIFLCILSWIMAVKLPAGSYVFLGPLLLLTLGLLLLQLIKNNAGPAAHAWASLPGTAFTVLLFAPIIYLLYVFLTLQLITIAAAAALLGIFFVACIPFMGAAVPLGNWQRAVLVLLVAGVASLIVGARESHYTTEHPRHDTILYSLNADDHSAVWISYDQAPDSWTSQFFQNKTPQRQPMPNYLAGTQRPVLAAPASPLPLAEPVAEVKADEKTGDVRKLELSIKAPGNPGAFYVGFADDVQPITVKVNGRDIPVNSSHGGLRMNLFGMGATGADLQLTVKAPSGIFFWLMDQSVGLPTEVHPRPNNFIAGDGSDITIVCRKYKL
jgi:peptidase M28-like protein